MRLARLEERGRQEEVLYFLGRGYSLLLCLRPDTRQNLGVQLGRLVRWDYEYHAYLAPAPRLRSSHCLAPAAAFQRGPDGCVALLGEER